MHGTFRTDVSAPQYEPKSSTNIEPLLNRCDLNFQSKSITLEGRKYSIQEIVHW